MGVAYWQGVARSWLTRIIILELSAALLAGVLAGALAHLGSVESEVGLSFVFMAVLHAMAGLVTAAALLIVLGLALFASVAGRLPRVMGGVPVSRRFAAPAVLCGLLVVAAVLALALS
jgi:hypothetical protein